jgi:SAM-dependent methyltransferase
MPEWHEDDRFWESFAPAMFTPERLAAAPGEVTSVLALVRTPPGAAILDLACGPGRHALELARRGFRVTGVDRTRVHVARARAAAAAEGLPVELLEGDMRAFVRPESFDLAVSLFTSFGYFRDPSDDRRVIENVARSLRPGGAFVIDVVGKEVLARIFQPRDWHELADGALWLEERDVDSGWSWMRNRWILIRDGRREEFVIELRLYSAAELGALLRDAGFASAEPFGSIRGTPYDEKAERLVIVARR